MPTTTARVAQAPTQPDVGRRRFGVSTLAVALGAAAGPLGWCAPAFAAEYPDKPVHIVVPFPPGGLTDILGRMVAERLRVGLQQTFVVDNRPGAGTLVGAGVVAKAPPDGYTLMVATSTTLGISPALYEGNSFKTTDLTGVAMLGDVTLLLITRPDLGAKNAEELVALIRAKPGSYNFASPGSGTVHHLLLEMLKSQEGLNATHVPYQGSGQALTDLMSGRIDFMLIDMQIGLPQVKAGKVKLLATTGQKRSSQLPDTPAITEKYPKLDLSAWQGIAAPAATPQPIVARVQAEINRALGTAEFREELAKVGVEARPMSSADFNEMLKRDLPRWAELVKRSGAKAN